MTLIQHRSSHSYLASHVHTSDPQRALTSQAIPSSGRVRERPRARARFTLQHQSGTCERPSDTVFGGTVNHLEPFCGAMHDTGGGEALRVVLEERASARVTVVGAIATVLYSITRETPKVSRCVAANCSRSLVDQ